MAWRGYFVKWTKTECINSVSTVSRGSRFTFHPQQRCGFRKEARKPETWKRDRGIPEETGPPPSEAADAVVSDPKSVVRGNLLPQEAFFLVLMSGDIQLTAVEGGTQHPLFF
uniref:Presenilins-associated rhomboid-like protein, mitochondrial n=1 Tax=Salmo salar TaxID=8030 RepID=B9ENQ1_SALSA|nr:Presenilins-associated rhomboid-like protein, mitochondrial precursor [Salmo salar]